MARRLKAGAIPPVPTHTDPTPEQQAGETTGQAEGEQQPATAEGAADKPKRRGRPRAAPPPSNVTDETIREHALKCSRFYGELQTAREGVSTAMGTYRAALKAAKGAGVPQQAISWWISAKGRDPADIDRETRERNRVAKVMALPIGHQLGLFEDGETVAHKVDQEKLGAEAAGERQPDDAYNAGKIAGQDGKPLSTNPYPEGEPAWDEFERGWGDGTSANVLGTAHGNGAAATAH